MGNLFKLMPLFFQMSFRVKEEVSHMAKLSCMLLSAEMSQPSYCLLMYLSSGEGEKRRKKSLLCGIYQITIVCKNQELDKNDFLGRVSKCCNPTICFPLLQWKPKQFFFTFCFLIIQPLGEKYLFLGGI